jgi:pyruvate carboxylase
MPGKIVKLLVAEGAGIEANQGLLVMEAMKMQSTVYAPVSGKIAQVLTQVGQSVEAKDLLVVIEPRA